MYAAFPHSLPCSTCMFIVDLMSTWLRRLQYGDPDDVGEVLVLPIMWYTLVHASIDAFHPKSHWNSAITFVSDRPN